MVKVEKLSENRVKLAITVSAEEFDVALDKAFEKVVKEVKVDGFRPGKMPKKMFIQRFGYEVLYNDAVDYAVNASYVPALQEAEVYPVSDPKFDLSKDEKIEKGNGFTYTVEVDVWPTVHLGEYKGLKVKKASPRVYKKDVDAYIDAELNKKAENVIKEDKAENGDTVVFDFEGFVDGVPFEGGKAENYSLVLGSGQFVPGFEDQLIGSKTDDELEVKVTFPKDYHEQLASKDAVFKCKIHEVKTKVVPTLTDDFVKELSIEGVETVAQYEEYAKNELKNKKTEEVNKQFENDVIEAVCKNSFADFPQSLITSSVEENLKRAEAQAKQYNMPVEVLLQYMGYPSVDEFKKTNEEQIRKQYLQELIFDEISKLENISATDEEVEAKFEQIAGSKENVSKVKKQYSKSAVEFQIRAEKVIELLKNSVDTK